MKIRDRIVDFRRVPARDLRPNPKNWRRHPQQQQDALRGLLAEIGYADALLVRQVDGGLQLLDGHLRAETTPDMDVPVLVLDLDDAEADKLLVTLDPLAGMATADGDDLRRLLEQVSTGSDAVQALLDNLSYQVAPVDPNALVAGGGPALTERFVVPPFSVLDARQGYWQERKQAWLALGIKGEAGRGETQTWGGDEAMRESTLEHYRKSNRPSSAPSGQPRPATKLGPDGKTVRGDGHGRPLKVKGHGNVTGHGLTKGMREDAQERRRLVKMAQATRAGHTGGEANRRTDVEGHGYKPAKDLKAHSGRSGPARAYKVDLMKGEDVEAPGTSVFDPVLAELVYRWFCPPDGSVLDPFAGGTPRGVVAGYLGHDYVGIDIRQEQVDSNVFQLEDFSTRHSLPSAPTWITGDSKDLDAVLDAGGCQGRQFDLVFTCPPYYDLEIYSLGQDDASALPSYEDFLAFYRRVFAQAVGRLAEDRFLVVVVGEIRDKQGIYRNFVGDTIATFRDLGLAYYNEAILVTAHGSLPIRAPRAFAASRKLGKTHQNVLVFFKGNVRRLPQVYPTDIDVTMPEQEEAPG